MVQQRKTNDNILINRKWESSILTARSFLSVDAGSDHQLILANVKFRLKVKYKSIRQKKFDIQKLKDANTKKIF